MTANDLAWGVVGACFAFATERAWRRWARRLLREKLGIEELLS
jgi:hypothetical protein